jgi:L-ascorbate metabolism protein UlaG (beta-lactamase superfamily)
MAVRRVTWLGQAGFRLDLGDSSFVVDPWVSPHENRLIPAPPLDAAADGVTALLITHEHFDHLDLGFLPTLLERSPTVTVVLPEALVGLVDGVVPESQMVTVNPHDLVEVGGVEIDVVPAIHGVTMDDAYGDGSSLGGGPRFVGYVFRGRPCIYVAGDTIVTDDVANALSRLEIEIAMLPINGRDAEREAQGIVGNMDAREAVELALAIRATRLLPYHWDGYAGNTVSPGTVVDAAAARIEVVVPARFGAVTL